MTMLVNKRQALIRYLSFTKHEFEPWIWYTDLVLIRCEFASSKTGDNYRWNVAENVSLSKWNFTLIVGLHQYLSQSSEMNDCDPECFITTSCAGRRLIICKSVDSADNKAQFQHSYPTIINLNSTTLSSE